jgi:hypothetical protein
VRSVGVVEVGEGVDVLVEAIEPAWQVVAGVELVSPGALGGFDGSVEVGPLWGRTKRARFLAAQASSNSAMNSEPPSTPASEPVKE